ncbi:NEAT domain-containing protein, partial [Peribacillus loiseleuriae]|uniref:NEAT domain-containing protein n=1 Tax=Peribacillus loiseleuriae TaxID=1679170 RepID=UPI0015D57722
MRKQFYKIISIFTMFLMIFGTLIPTYSPVFAETQPLADGEYKINFQVLKDGSEAISVMDGYTEKPAILKVENGNKYVELTLKNSNWIKKFQVEKDGVYSDAEVISEDDGKATRVVRFEVENLSEKLNAFTHVIVTGIPGLNYDSEYTVQFKFDLGSLVEVNVPTPEPEEPEKPEPTYEDGEYTINFRTRN